VQLKLYGQKYRDKLLTNLIQAFQSDPFSQVNNIKHPLSLHLHTLGSFWRYCDSMESLQ